MEYLKVIVLSFTSLFTLFVLTKLMGNRQISQLTLFDYIVGITIGSIAAEMATSLEDNFGMPFIAMCIYAITTFFISFLSIKFIKFRRFISGKSILLYENGIIYQDNLKKSNIDIEDFLTQCRGQGYFNLSEIQIALLEFNGKLSILPQSTNRPVNPNDLNLQVSTATMPLTIVSDGTVINENLKVLGKNTIWLQNQLRSRGYNDVSSILLATCDINNSLNIFTYYQDKKKKIFNKNT